MSDHAGREGFTLLELTTGTVLLMIVISAVTVLFTVERTQSILTQRQAEVIEEARIAMDNLEWVLRFAIPDNTLVVDAVNHRITATIEGDHIALVPDDTTVRYQLTGRALTCTVNLNRPDAQTFTIANNITAFDPSRNQEDITISLTAAQGGNTITLQSTIRALGGQ